MGRVCVWPGLSVLFGLNASRLHRYVVDLVYNERCLNSIHGWPGTRPWLLGIASLQVYAFSF